MPRVSKIVLALLLALLLGLQGALLPLNSFQPAEAAWSPPGPDAKGVQPLLIILAQPSNQAPVGHDDAAYWHNLAFGPFPSVTDYYWAASYGQLQLVPAQENDGTPNDGVVGWINVGAPHPNTYTNPEDPKNAAFVTATLKAVSASGAVNFASFDTNHDGVLEPHELRLVVVVAGLSPGYGGYNLTSSAHTCLSPALTLNGVRVFSCSQQAGYSLVNEWNGTVADGSPQSLGTVVHELGHNLGLPDLYDLTYKTWGVGDWSVMGMGIGNTYVNGDQRMYLPALPDAWSRAYLGWLTPQEVQGSILNAGIPQAESSPVVFQLMPNPGGIDWRMDGHSGTGEYYLVENREKVGYDAGLPGCGLLIWHIDEAAPADDYAESNAAHPLVRLVQADSFGQPESMADTGDDGDPFPGSANRRAWGPGSDFPATLHNGQPSPAGVANISDCGAMMSADLYSSGMPIPPGPLGDFADVDIHDPAYASIREVMAKGWSNGCGTDSASGKPLFCPDRLVTRREMLAFLLRFYQSPSHIGESQEFADVPPSDWGYPFAQTAVYYGLTKGCGTDPMSGEKLFCPDRLVTRREVAAFIAHWDAAGRSPGAQVFQDVPPSDWGFPYVQALAANDVTGGCATDPATGGKLFNPNGAITRAQLAQILVKWYVNAGYKALDEAMQSH